MEWLVAVVTLGVFCNQKKHEVLISVDKIEKKPIAFCAVIVEKARQIIKNLGGFLTTLLSRMEYLFRISRAMDSSLRGQNRAHSSHVWRLGLVPESTGHFTGQKP